MVFLTVDQEKCLHDGLCALECPMGLILINKGTQLPQTFRSAENSCIKCGHCVAVCPAEALTVAGIHATDCLPVDHSVDINAEQVAQLIKSRRSIRVYKNKPIEGEKLTQLIDIARYAPSGSNSQQVQWLVINGREQVKKLAAATIEFMNGLLSQNNPLSEKYNLAILVKRWNAGIDGIFRGAPGLIITHAPRIYGLATVDSTLALSCLNLAASSLELGCCWAGFFMIAVANSAEIQNRLYLPEGNVCTGALMIGYPKNVYRRIPPRKDPIITWVE